MSNTISESKVRFARALVEKNNAQGIKSSQKMVDTANTVLPGEEITVAPKEDIVAVIDASEAPVEQLPPPRKKNRLELLDERLRAKLDDILGGQKTNQD